MSVVIIKTDDDDDDDERETANEVINNDIELLINKFAGNMEGIHIFSDQMQMYILIFCLTLTYCI